MATGNQSLQATVVDFANGLIQQGQQALNDPMSLSSLMLFTACALIVIYSGQRRRARRRAERVAHQNTERMAERLQKENNDNRVVVISSFQRKEKDMPKRVSTDLQSVSLAGRRRRGL